jgi:hypothetical protein
VLSVLRDPRFFLLIGTMGFLSCGCGGLLLILIESAASKTEAEIAAMSEEEQIEYQLDQVDRIARFFGVDVSDDLNEVRRVTAEMASVQAEIDAAQADGEVTPEEEERIRISMDEMEQRLAQADPVPDPVPDYAAPKRPPPPSGQRVEKIQFHPDPDPPWTPPVWLVVGGVAGSILLLGVGGAALTLMRGADAEEEAEMVARIEAAKRVPKGMPGAVDDLNEPTTEK